MALVDTPVTLDSFDSPEQLAAALQGGIVSEHDVLITNVFVDGQDVGSIVPRARASLIKYVVVSLDPSFRIPPELGPIAPNPRRYNERAVVGASVDELAKIVVYGNDIRLKVREDPDFRFCDGSEAPL